MVKLIAVLIGMLITLMITLNGSLATITGNYSSSVVIHLLGLIGTILVMWLTKSKLQFRYHLPVYLYSAGVIGVLTVLFNNISFEGLGVSLTVALGLLGQSIASLIVDQYGLLGMKKINFNRRKITGLILITLGIIVMSYY